MKIKVGDQVKIIAGKDKGKEGKIIKTLKNKDKVVVENCNMIKKHIKPGRTTETGGILDMEAPIHVSNVKKIETTKAKKEVKEAKAESKKEVKEASKKAPAKKTTKKETEKKASK